MHSFFFHSRTALRTAFGPTVKSCSWLLKLMIPISLTVTLLQFFGVLAWMAQYLNPCFSALGLPGSGAVVFISGAAAGTYAGLAAMMSVPLTLRQATILALMIGLCHALPMECAVNKKTGSSALRMGAIRILMAMVCALTMNLLLPEIEGDYIYLGAAAESTFAEVVATWAVSQLKMSAMVFLIIYLLMVVQRLLEEYELLQPLSRLLSPLMRVFGIPQSTAYMWLVGNVIGLSYGSAIMLELEERGQITRREANEANYHLIMNHSLLEDTLVFALTGISALWVAGTRVAFAILVVWLRKAVKIVL